MISFLCLKYGIPPETIKDSMKLGIPVPQVYIVPVERFCREMGPALGVNLAEFEFPAYFNFFVHKKRCTLVVDSSDAEENIRRVFSETLLGPAQFRGNNSKLFEDEDFAPGFPRETIPNFPAELKHFRIMPDGKELVLETLLEFKHFELLVDKKATVGKPLIPGNFTPGESPCSGNLADDQDKDRDDDEAMENVPKNAKEFEKRHAEQNPWTFSQTSEMGK